jgi:hypothetical protein
MIHCDVSHTLLEVSPEEEGQAATKVASRHEVQHVDEAQDSKLPQS